MKDVLNLLYFVFGLITAYGAFGIVFWVVDGIKNTEPYKNPEDPIFNIGRVNGLFAIMEVGIIGLLATFVYSKIFL